ncbi:Uncharacterized protein DBV15_12294, partial [Temnothorax longispinosus]
RSAAVHRRFFSAAHTSKKQKEYKDDNLRLSPLAQRIDFTGFHERAQNRADRRCSGLCLKTNEHRTARSSSRNRENEGAKERQTEGDRARRGRQHRVTNAEPIFGSAKCKQNDRPVMHRGIWRKSSNRERGGPIPAVPAHARIISAGQGIFITWGPSRLEQMLDEAARVKYRTLDGVKMVQTPDKCSCERTQYGRRLRQGAKCLFLSEPDPLPQDCQSVRPGQPPTSPGTLPSPTPTQPTEQKPAGTRATRQLIFCEAPMHDEERRGDGDGSAVRLERDNEGDRDR